MFEKASRLKLRFNTQFGVLSAKDLWDLGLEQLDSEFKKLNKELKAEDEESLLETKSKANTLASLRVDIIKHIVKAKLEEKDAREAAAEKKEKKEKLLALIADKQDETLKNMSEEELRKELEAL